MSEISEMLKKVVNWEIEGNEAILYDAEGKKVDVMYLDSVIGEQIQRIIDMEERPETTDKKEDTLIVNFWRDDGKESFMFEITKEGSDITKEEIETLLDEYRISDANYNADGWYEYLTERGYTVKYISPDVGIYF